MDDIGTAFVAHLNEIMNALGLRNVEVARMIGVSSCSVAGWRKGRIMPDSYNLAMLCKAFGVSADWMLGIELEDEEEEEKNKWQKRAML